jgi:hypothetical protein
MGAENVGKAWKFKKMNQAKRLNKIKGIRLVYYKFSYLGKLRSKRGP